jgi:hypothetical protein
MFLRKVSTSVQECTASHSSRRETERDTHRESQTVQTLLSAEARRFQDAIMSEQTLEWFCNAARSAAGVAVVFGLAACLFAARCTTC